MGHSIYKSNNGIIVSVTQYMIKIEIPSETKDANETKSVHFSKEEWVDLVEFVSHQLKKKFNNG